MTSRADLGEKLLEAMARNPGASTAELAAALGVGKGSVLRRCADLARHGVLVKRSDRRWALAAPPARRARSNMNLLPGLRARVEILKRPRGGPRIPIVR
jgi:DNA-binding IclR family transcriptional regulator